MLVRKGWITKGSYCGGEWNERNEDIEAEGKNEKKLAKEVKRLTELHTNKGHQIDFGFVDGKASVEWDPDIYKVKKYTPKNTQAELNL